MGRVSDYIRFAVWLVGAGYIALWPLIANDGGGPLGAALICPSLLAFLCHFPHPIVLPPGLQWIGFLSALWLCFMLVLRLIARLLKRQVRRMRAASALSARIPAAVRRKPQKPLTPLRRVQPRNHFGLRGRPD